MTVQDLKKQIRSVDLAISAGQKRQSPRTGFVHLFHHDDATDTIPIYENFCYAFALFRQKTADSVAMGKELILRLLAFQGSDGNFPIYLHDFPRCYDSRLGLKVAPILAYLLRLFSGVLGELKPAIEQALSKAVSISSEEPFWENRIRACKGLSLLPCDPSGLSPSEWIDWVITAQLAGQNHFSLPYDPNLQLLKFHSRYDAHEKGEPRPHPLEWILAEGSFSSRLLRDHPHQLRCAPIFPFTYTHHRVADMAFRYYWKGSSLHSLAADGFLFDLAEEAELGRKDLFEAALFCDISPETQVWVEGRKATVFRLGDEITIETPDRSIRLKFELIQGVGDFCGHIYPSNRPSQLCKGYEAYDWKIGVRTLRRSPKARIELVLIDGVDVDPEDRSSLL